MSIGRSSLTLNVDLNDKSPSEDATECCQIVDDILEKSKGCLVNFAGASPFAHRFHVSRVSGARTLEPCKCPPSRMLECIAVKYPAVVSKYLAGIQCSAKYSFSRVQQSPPSPPSI